MIINDFLIFLLLFVLCHSSELVDGIDINDISEYTHFFQTNTFSPKQTLTPITFAPTPSATSSNNSNVFTSLEMIIFYIVFGMVVIIVVVGIIIYRCHKNKEITITANPNEVNVIEAMNQPLADNPNLPDEGLVQI